MSSQKSSLPLILALPGYNDPADKFLPLAALLKDRYRLIALDYPYLKSSSKPFTLDDSVNFLKDFVNSHRLNQFILLGFSYGSFVATKYAFQHPEKISKLYFLNYSPKIIRHAFFRKIYTLIKPFLLTRFFIFLYSRLSTTSLRSLINRQPLKPFEKNNMLSRPYSVFGTLFNFLDTDQTTEFIRLSIPKTLVLFEDDQVLKWPKYQNLIKSLNGNLKLIKTGGHAFGPDYWTQVAALF